MEQRVLALDLLSIPAGQAAGALVDVLGRLGNKPLVAVSSFAGVDGWIAAALESANEAGFDAASILSRLRAQHRDLLLALDAPSAATDAAILRLDRILSRLWTLIACPAIGGSRRLRSLEIGEALAANAVALALASIGLPSPLFEASQLRGFEDQNSGDAQLGKLQALPGAVVSGYRSAWLLASALGLGEPRVCVLEAQPGAHGRRSRQPADTVAFAPTVA